MMTARLLLLLLPAVILGACSQKSGEQDGGEEIDLTQPEQEKAIKEPKGYILPSPFELASLISKSGAPYNKAILNPVANASKYTESVSKGLNLGVFGADLGYSLMYDKSQDGVDYLHACTKLANDLGVIGAFENSTVKRIEKNITNRDSLILIATDNFSRVDMYLKENDRQPTSALILSGGWIEGLYIATEIAKSGAKKDIMERIGEQKLSLDLLIEHTAKFRDSEGFAGLLEDMGRLKDIYKDVTISYDYKESTVDTSLKISTFNSTSSININDETFSRISEMVASIRNKIIGQ